MEEETEHHSKITQNTVNIADLISELDEMDGTSERNQIVNQLFKNCLNQECMYNLPKDAKFCLKCGTAQMPKFCTECGYSFPGMEKFCPDCGNKR
jgi:RNA polymerase subunit RPABC4/transcription elongation factor Spt4